MSSQVDPSIPRAGNADTARLRHQFGIIKSEIEALQQLAAELQAELQAIGELPADAVDASRLSAVAFSGSYYHLTHRPSIPSNAEQIGALPKSGGAMSGPLELADNATTALAAVPLQQMNNAFGALSKVARSGAYYDLTHKPALGTAAATDATAYATAAQGALADTALQQADLAAVATSGNYSDLSNRPILGTAAATAAADYATAAQGSKADTAVQPESLAPVATTGSYADLVNRPALGTAAATDASAYATATQGARADTAVQPADLAPVATAGDFASLSGTVTEQQLDPSLVAKVNNTIPYKVDATRPPGASDDVTQGWAVGSLWVDVSGQEAYRCVSASAGAAIWANTTLTTAELANVALSGSYTDLVNKPALAAVALSGSYTDLANRPTFGTAAFTNSTAYATAAQGSKADTAVQPGALATVATSGSYADLSGKPALGSAAFTNSTAYATAAQGSKADTAVQPGALAAVATTGNYADLSGRPSALSQFSNDTGFITSAQVPESPVTSVNGKTGAVSLTHVDVGAAASAHSHSSATGSLSGFMSAADKNKLDGLAAVATSGDYSDLSGRPTFGSAAFTNSTAYATAAQGSKADTAVQPNALATVATSGNYEDLTNKPSAATGRVLPPVNHEPGFGEVVIDPSQAVLLVASAFSASGTDTHQASQWQVSTDPEFSTITYDSGEVTT